MKSPWNVQPGAFVTFTPLSVPPNDNPVPFTGQVIRNSSRGTTTGCDAGQTSPTANAMWSRWLTESRSRPFQHVGKSR